MLVFTRKVDEAIIIGDGIEVRVIRVGRDAVRLGIRAPLSVPVHRHEIYEQIRAANASAAGDPDSLAAAASTLRRPAAASTLRRPAVASKPTGGKT